MKRDLHQKQDEITNLIDSFCLTLLQNLFENSFKNSSSAVPTDEKKFKKLQNFECTHISEQFMQ